ncbi:hypothetical protein Q3G72_005727 [Acer saccharum]|nr:hypothetical protein Q3G72_005727 [Acer saccharum]
MEQNRNGNKSFVEAVKGDRVLKGEQDRDGNLQKGIEQGGVKELSMFWNSHQREDNWLRRCAVGVLKPSQMWNVSIIVTVQEENAEVEGSWIEDFLGLKRLATVASQKVNQADDQSKEEDRWAVGEKGVRDGSLGKTIAQIKRGQIAGSKGVGKKGGYQLGSEETTTSEEEGQISDFNFWRGERGECSRRKAQRKTPEIFGDGLVPSKPTNGLQNSNDSVKTGTEGKSFISRSQSLDGPLKDYLENLEQAFLRSKLEKSKNSHAVDCQPMVNTMDQNMARSDEDTSSVRSVFLVHETRDPAETNSSEEDQDKEYDNFKSVSATREDSRKAENGGGQLMTKDDWNGDEEVFKVMEIGAQLGIDFRGKESEVAKFIRHGEKEDADQCSRDGGQ